MLIFLATESLFPTIQIMESNKKFKMAEVYEKLRERLDMFPQGFPKTQSGVELEILQVL